MFKFFTNPKWYAWAYIGSVVILTSIWVQVQIDVLINEWFGEFYDMIQKALGTPNAVTMQEYMGSLASFAQLAVLSIVLGLAISFLTSHFLFRWRTAMVEWYHSVYDKARTIEGASQRVQEDTIKFSRIMEGLGTSLIESVLVLVEFFPLLMTLSIGIPILWFGDWQYGLVSGAFIRGSNAPFFIISFREFQVLSNVSGSLAIVFQKLGIAFILRSFLILLKTFLTFPLALFSSIGIK